MTRWRAPLMALALLAVAAACAEEGGVATQDIVAAIPWSDGEKPLVYTIMDGGKERGRATLSIRREDGRVLLEQSSSDGRGNSDVSIDGRSGDAQAGGDDAHRDQRGRARRRRGHL